MIRPPMKRVAILFTMAVFLPSLALAWLATRFVEDRPSAWERRQALRQSAAAESLSGAINHHLVQAGNRFVEAAEELLGQGTPTERLLTFGDSLRRLWPLAEAGFVVSPQGEWIAPPLDERTEAGRFLAEHGRFFADRLKTLEGRRGTLSVFLEDRLRLLFWYRPPRESNTLYGAYVNLARLADELRPLLNPEPSTPERELGIALLDDTGQPVAVSAADFVTEGCRPLATAAIGETLPHWKVGLYPLASGRLTEPSPSAQWALGLLILGLLAAIGVGGWRIIAEVRRQLRLARQEMEFVSNVARELKTQLTSIRMFSGFLEEATVEDPEQQRRYLRFIGAEAARLSRLINNVLDFARLERDERPFHFVRCDLVALLCETLNGYRPHLETARFSLEFTVPGAPLMVHGDHDALAQVLVNLLSNAEKYSGERREIRVEMGVRDEPKPHVELRVLDRGIGVPQGAETRIFEKFFRAGGSQSSAVQGSGLGLALARQIARAHGGEVTYEPREGGRSCFALLLPLPPQSAGADRAVWEDTEHTLAREGAGPAALGD